MGYGGMGMGYLQDKKEKRDPQGTQIWNWELAAGSCGSFRQLLGEARIKNQITKRTILKSDTRPKQKPIGSR
jgi:hypothetical protein